MVKCRNRAQKSGAPPQHEPETQISPPRANRHRAVPNALPDPICRTCIKIAGSPKAARRNHDYEKQTVNFDYLLVGRVYPGAGFTKRTERK